MKNANTFHTAIDPENGSFLLPGVGWVYPDKKGAKNVIGSKFAAVTKIHRTAKKVAFYDGEAVLGEPGESDLARMFMAFGPTGMSEFIDSDVIRKKDGILLRGKNHSFFFKCWDAGMDGPKSMGSLLARYTPAPSDEDLDKALLAGCYPKGVVTSLWGLPVVTNGKSRYIAISKMEGGCELVSANRYNISDCASDEDVVQRLCRKMWGADIDLREFMARAQSVRLHKATAPSDVDPIIERAEKEGIVYYGSGSTLSVGGFGWTQDAAWKLVTHWCKASAQKLCAAMASYNSDAVAILDGRASILEEAHAFKADSMVASVESTSPNGLDQFSLPNGLVEARNARGVEYLRFVPGSDWTDKELSLITSEQCCALVDLINEINDRANGASFKSAKGAAV